MPHARAHRQRSRRRARGAARGSLLHVLRNDLGLNGPKYGCGLGQCGACTVLGRRRGGARLRDSGRMAWPAARSPRSKAWARATSWHPVQQAFEHAQAAQCGYCLNGMVMQAAALLRARAASERSADPRASCRATCAAAARMSRSWTRCSAPRRLTGVSQGRSSVTRTALRRCRPRTRSDFLRGRRRAAGRRARPPPAAAASAGPAAARGRQSGRRRRDPAGGVGRRQRHRAQRPCRPGHRPAHRAGADRRRGTRCCRSTQVHMVLGDTARAPNQGATIASASIQIHAGAAAPGGGAGARLAGCAARRAARRAAGAAGGARWPRPRRRRPCAARLRRAGGGPRTCCSSTPTRG